MEEKNRQFEKISYMWFNNEVQKITSFCMNSNLKTQSIVNIASTDMSFGEEYYNSWRSMLGVTRNYIILEGSIW